jgi:bacterioferritin-associated ferredoxin
MRGWPSMAEYLPSGARPAVYSGAYRHACVVSQTGLNAIDNHSHLRLNDDMYVCICNAITERQIRKAAESGVKDLWDLQRELGVAAGCGSCKEMASEILRESRSARASEPVRYRPSAS